MTKKEAKPAAPAAEGEGEAPPKKRNLLLIIGGAVGALVFLGMAAVIVILLLRPTAAAPAAAAAVDAEGNPVEAAVDAEGNPVEAAAAEPKLDMNAPPVPPALPIPGEGVMFDVGTKVINLADPGGRRYLKVGIVLEFAPHDTAWYTMATEQRAELQALFETEMATKQPVIEDLVISIISSKSFEQVYTLEGKEGLRQEIINRINQMLPTQLVMYVYFNEFVVQ